MAQINTCIKAIGEISESFSESHSSEGQLIIKGDTIFNVFRFDSVGSQVGYDPKLVMRYSKDSGKTWSSESVVFDSLA
jgi:hypothetical protein